jgi:4-hydroxy-tetrahydrodipicolinate synthase
VLARTQTYAAALGNVKAWYEVIGLKGGPKIPPVGTVPPERKEEIREKLVKAGVV